MAKKLPKFINEDQFNAMVEQINPNCFMGARNIAILTVIFRSGLRVSEVADLLPGYLYFENGLIFIEDGKGKKDRYTVLDDATIEVIKNWMEFRPDNAEYLFCTKKGGQLDTRYIRDMHYRVSEKAGVYIQSGREQKKVSPHKLRHGFATRAYHELGMSLQELQEMLGHSEISTTSIYLHTNPLAVAKKYRERSV